MHANYFAMRKGLQDLKKRIIFLFLAILVYRIGAHIPIPGLNPAKLQAIFAANRGGIFGLFNLFSGGALSRLTIFALGIFPYISASIIIQLLSMVFPPLEQLKKEGHLGRKKLGQYTRYLTIFLATIHAIGTTKFIGTLNSSPSGFFVVVLTLVTGTVFLMWLAEQITERGIGNGTSMLIFSSIVSNIPNAIANTLERVRQGEIQVISLLLLISVMIIIISFIVFIERGQRKIVVHYPRRQQGQSSSGDLPLKINMASVMPPIFASSVILFPATLGQWFGGGVLLKLNRILAPGQPMYVALFAIAVVFFCFLYTALLFSPKDTADNLKKSGCYISGIRPGEQTAKFIDKIMTRLTIIGALYITSVSLLPEFLNLFMRVPFYFGGTSLLITVLVVIDFMVQINSHLMSHKYSNLLKKSKLKI